MKRTRRSKVGAKTYLAFLYMDTLQRCLSTCINGMNVIFEAFNVIVLKL